MPKFVSFSLKFESANQISRTGNGFDQSGQRAAAESLPSFYVRPEPIRHNDESLNSERETDEKADFVFRHHERPSRRGRASWMQQ